MGRPRKTNRPVRCKQLPILPGETRPRCSNHNEPMVSHKGGKAWRCAVKNRAHNRRHYHAHKSPKAEVQLTPRERAILAKRVALHRRHAMAMRMIRSVGVDERWELLAAVVWPESETLRNMEEAA